MIWLAYILTQLITLVFNLLMIFFLGWPIYRQAWIKDELSNNRLLLAPGGVQFQRFDIDRWSWQPLNWIYGNPEDGVSGQQAYIWQSGGQVPYSSQFPAGTSPRWIALCWNFRNNADELKYVFRYRGSGRPPLVQGTWIAGRTFKMGYQLENGFYVPVLSL